jgi:TonB-dependent SusC/RagA subfamily outer membrane receptor
MIALSYYLLKVIFCSGILYGYYHLALRNKIFHEWNRFYLLAIIPISILLPLLDINVIAPEESSSKILTAMKIVAEADDHLFNEAPGSGWHLSTELLIGSVYTIVSAVILAMFITGLFKIAAMVKKYNHIHLGEILFLNTREQGTPFSFFKYLFWNEEISPDSENGKRIMEHELVHIREKHSWDKIFVHLSLVFFWANPFFWLARKELAMIHEFIADRKTIGNGDVKAFAKLILEASFPQHASLLTNSFFQSSIKRRISMITKKHQQFSYLSRLMMIPVIFILVFSFAVKANNMLNNPKSTPAILEKKYTVVVDAGHGGSDDGAVAGLVKEKDLALSMALLIKSLSNNPNINIVLTRSTDVLQPIKDKTVLAEQANADLFVSLHVNSAKSPDSSGMMTFISARNTDFHEENVRFASLLLSNLSGVYKTDPTIRQRTTQGIWVLDANKCPAAIIECGYVSNPTDRSFISKNENQKKIAEQILRSIEEYFSTNVKVNTSAVKPATAKADTVVPGKKAPETFMLRADTLYFKANSLGKKSDTSRIPDNAIYTINGITVTPEIVGSIEPGKIASINVTKKDGKNQIDLILKDSKDAPPVGTAKPNGAVTFIGYPDDAKGMKAVIGYPIDPKDPKDPKAVIGYAIDPKDPKAVIGYPIDPKENGNKEVIVKGYKISPIMIVNGKEMSVEEADKISPDQIAEVTVLKGEAAKALYGEKGKHGVVLITTKK